MSQGEAETFLIKNNRRSLTVSFTEVSFLIRIENVFNEWDKGKNLVGGPKRKKLAACCRIRHWFQIILNPMFSRK